MTNIFISSYIKFTYKILSQKAKWFLLLALKFDLYVKYVKVNPWVLFIHNKMGLMQMLHTKFRVNRSSGSGEYFERFITYMGFAAILVMCPTSCHFILFSSCEKACIQNLAKNCPLLS